MFKSDIAGERTLYSRRGFLLLLQMMINELHCVVWCVAVSRHRTDNCRHRNWMFLVLPGGEELQNHGVFQEHDSSGRFMSYNRQHQWACRSDCPA